MPNENEIILNFIGSNYGIMKKLDDQIIGSSSTLQRRSDDVKRIMHEVVTNIQPHAPHAPQLQVMTQPQVVQQINDHQAVNAIQNDGQLWLSFEERDEIYEKLDRIYEKLDFLIKKIEKLESNTNIPRKRGI